MSAQFEILIKEEASSAPQGQSVPVGRAVDADRDRERKVERAAAVRARVSDDSPQSAAGSRQFSEASDIFLQAARTFRAAVDGMGAKGSQADSSVPKPPPPPPKAPPLPKQQAEEKPQEKRKPTTPRARTYQEQFSRRANERMRQMRRMAARTRGRARTAVRVGARRAKAVSGRVIGPRGRMAARSVVQGGAGAARAVGGAAAGGARAAAAGLGRLAAAAGPAGLVIGGLIAGLAAAGFAAKKFADTVEREVNKAAQYSGAAAGAVARTDIQRMEAEMNRARRLGDDLARFERSRSNVEQSIENAKTEVLGILLRLAEPLLPVVETIATSVELTAAQTAVVADNVRLIYAALPGGLTVEEAMADLAKSQQKVAEILDRKDEKEDGLRDDFTEEFLTSIQRLKGMKAPLPVPAGGV